MLHRPSSLLNEESNRILVRQMLIRAGVAGPVNVIFYLALVATLKNMSKQPWVWWMFALVCVSGALRYGCYWFEKNYGMTTKSQGILRALFGVASICSAATWGGAALLVLQDGGLTSDTAILLMTLFGMGATAVASFSFDLPVLLTFLQMLYVPAAISAFLSPHPELFAFGTAFLFFDGFISFVGLSQHRFQVKSMQQLEMILSQKDELEELNNSMRTVENSLEEGLMLIGPDGHLQKTTSPRAHELMGQDPTGRHICDVLNISGEDRTNVEDWLRLSFSQKFDFNQIASLGPGQFHDPQRELTVHLRYRAKMDTEGKLDSILMVAKDVSREVEAERVAQENVARAEMILQVLKDPQSFREFLAETSQSLKRIVNGEFNNSLALNRELHTLKGSAGIFNVVGLCQQIHEVERLLRLDSSPDRILNCGINLATYFDHWQVSEKDLITLVNRATHETPSIRTFEDFLLGFAATINTTAASLNKRVRLQVKSFGPVIPMVSPAPPALRTLIHLFNNAVDHGIESPELRLRSGKGEEGLISVMVTQSIQDSRSFVRLTISDDGGGINEPGLRQALERRNPGESLPSDPIELYQRIFDDSVSSRTVITQLSGYGVGLGAVRAATVDCGGRVRVVKSDASGTTIEILFPEEIFIDQSLAA